MSSTENERGKARSGYAVKSGPCKKNQTISHAFVELDAFDFPWKDSLKIDADSAGSSPSSTN